MKLEDFCQINPTVQLNRNEEYEFVEMADLVPGDRYVISKNKKVFNGSFSKFSNKDTLMAKITPCLENGKISQYIGASKAFGSTEFNIFREKENISDANYLYYLVSSTIVKDPAIKSMSGATGRQRANLDEIKQINVPDFNIATQEKIAKILSNYDDLIENNNKRIKILEEMAQKIYKEWFVDFKFPNHETATFKDSELGKIPTDWGSCKLKNICSVIFSGGTPSTNIDKYWNGNLHWLSSGETSSKYIIETQKTITELAVNKSSTRLAKINDIVIASAGQGKTRGQVAYCFIDTFINQSLISMRSIEKIDYSKFIFFNLLSRYNELRLLSDSSSSRGSLTVKIMENINILLPSDDILLMFNKIVKPMLELTQKLQIKQQYLKQTRDLLLPRLISGEIDVENLEIL